MRQTRRQFLTTTAATAGTVTILPFAALAAGEEGHVFETSGGAITVHPVAHASFVMETPVGTIYCDPVGEPASYADLPEPDLILITHEHGDHFNAETLAALVGENTRLLTNPAVYSKLPEALMTAAEEIGNGGTTEWNGLPIEAIPAYNLTEDRLNFHPQGRDNGYVLGFDGFRVYISGDTEDIPEMRALQDISLAFVCMNLPFTMDVTQAASAVAEFKPGYVYPYHFRGRDGGTQDPAEFAQLIGDGIEVKMGDWYA